jgi:hypothetical protein
MNTTRRSFLAVLTALPVVGKYLAAHPPGVLPGLTEAKMLRSGGRFGALAEELREPYPLRGITDEGTYVMTVYNPGAPTSFTVNGQPLRIAREASFRLLEKRNA